MNAPLMNSNIINFKAMKGASQPIISDLCECLVISSPMLPSSISIKKDTWHENIEFDDFFRHLKYFDLPKTISNMKKLVIRRRLDRKLSAGEARFAWNAIIKRIAQMRFADAHDYLINGWASIDEIVQSYQKTVPAKTRRATIELFSRSCTGFLYPENITVFKSMYWDSIKSQINRSLC